MYVSSQLTFGSKGIHVAISSLQDTGTNLTVTANYYIKPQQTTGAALTAEPGISNIDFSDDGQGAFFGVSHFLDPLYNYRSMMYTRIGTAQGGTTEWSMTFSYFDPIPFEVKSQPHIFQRGDKLFTAIVVN